MIPHSLTASDVNDEEAKEKIKSRPSIPTFHNGNLNLEANAEDADMSKFFDSDFSCFFCRKKCYSKERFFSHFRDPIQWKMMFTALCINRMF